MLLPLRSFRLDFPLWFALFAVVLLEGGVSAQTAPVCARTITAKVVALEQTIYFNRLGAHLPGGMIFALKRDVVSSENRHGCDGPEGQCTPGHVQLREGKRPRPLVLRINVGDCLDIEFTNYLTPLPPPPVPLPPQIGSQRPSQTFTRYAGVHIQGLQLVNSIASDASWVGDNPNSLTAPGATNHYRYYARGPHDGDAGAEGAYLIYSFDDSNNSGCGNGQACDLGQLSSGLFGALNVEPAGAQWYRSQVLRSDLDLAQTGKTNLGQPIVNYEARYPNNYPVNAGAPILNMLDGTEIVHSDLTAIITGPGAKRFPDSDPSPVFKDNPSTPDRRQPYREFTILYHTNQEVVQAFRQFDVNTPLSYTLGEGSDQFGINYGMAGIGAEILANRSNPSLCPECKFEEFFLSAWAVGDPAMVVQVVQYEPVSASEMPAARVNFRAKGDLQPENAPMPERRKAVLAKYPDDPSNVYHSYLRDHVKFRILNASSQLNHVHHQHAHQWLHTPNSDESTYLDSQMIVPGAAYTLEMTYGGSGNKNLTAGDSIFHCHFYPHFAQGMWSLWRVHDVLEEGTELAENGAPKPGWNRALPDYESTSGTPIPAVVPVPTLAMALPPARIQLVENGTRAIVEHQGAEVKNPGYPFFVPGVAGHRPPHPPLDFACNDPDPKADQPCNDSLDGGLPRHLVLDAKIVREYHTRWDFSKDFVDLDQHGKFVDGGLKAFQLPELGTDVEIAAMKDHEIRDHPSFFPNGTATPSGQGFLMNGLPRIFGAPFARPDITFDGKETAPNNYCKPEQFDDCVVRYKAAVVQRDVVLNKKGYHYPQQRFITLWGDVKPTMSGERPPEPFFFRANSDQTVEFWHTNLVPDYYQLDDFQVKTPTDILGQHIHLVKFDVLASDGAANGFNYEDGTFAPDEVQGRVAAIDHWQPSGGLYVWNPALQDCLNKAAPLSACVSQNGTQTQLTAKPPGWGNFGPPPAPHQWDGAQATVQRWYADPVENNAGKDRTLRTVFTHDHFGPSTHQNVGLYAGLLTEPKHSRWFESDKTNQPLFSRPDGGPTTWQANIEFRKPEEDKSYREFALEFQDLQLAYTAGSKAAMQPLTHNPPLPGDPPLFSQTFKIADMSTFEAQLNAGTLPPQLQQEWVKQGVDVAAASPVTKCTTTPNTWCIQYHLDVISMRAVAQTLSFFTPINAWASPHFAVEAPGALNNLKPPYPYIISSSDNGTYSLNYRNEPLPFRVNTNPPDAHTPLNKAKTDQATDMAYVFQSIPRVDSQLNIQPDGKKCKGNTAPCAIDPNQPAGFSFPGNPLIPGPNGAQDQDPYTPLLRAYQKDKVQIRTLVGAHFDTHSFQAQGLKWQFEPSDPNSGFKDTQGMGLSEHFEMLIDVPKSTSAGNYKGSGAFSDYLYIPSSALTGLTNGLWGILRAWNGGTPVADLRPLPNNPVGLAATPPKSSCPADAPKKSFSVTATTASQAITKGSLIYNPSGQATGPLNTRTFPPPPLQDAGAIFYTLTSNISKGTISGTVEPLILRAEPGDCIEVQLTNGVNPNLPVFQQRFRQSKPFEAQEFNTPPSTHVGLHPQLLSYDIDTSSTDANGNILSTGINVGFDPDQSVAPGQTRTYRWYAGTTTVTPDGTVEGTPVEFGSINLLPTDPLMHHQKGLVGVLIVEPKGTKFVPDPGTQAAGTVTDAAGKKLFREFVVDMETTLNVNNLEPPTQPAQFQDSAFNYRSEPTTWRYGVINGPAAKGTPDISQQLSNSLVIGDTTNRKNGDPNTPIFTAVAGQPVRFRVLYPGGDVIEDQVFGVAGHSWQEEPFVNGSTSLGSNPKSQLFGSQQISPNERFDALIPSAGGTFGIPGDYLYSTFLGKKQGLWGIFRVTAAKDRVKPVAVYLRPDGKLAVEGVNTANADTGEFASQVTVYTQPRAGEIVVLGSARVGPDGAWKFTSAAPLEQSGGLRVVSEFGGSATVEIPR